MGPSQKGFHSRNFETKGLDPLQFTAATPYPFSLDPEFKFLVRFEIENHFVDHGTVYR
jgi:hypothetical protein